jgi:hypothetical protein
MAKSFVQFQFLIGCFSDILQMNMSMWNCIAHKHTH